MTNGQREVTRVESPVEENAFTVLASERRRTVLRCLRTAEAPVAMADLASDVVARERNVNAGDVTEEAAERVHLTLYHTHVPKLVDAGYLRYDDDRTTVSLTDDAESLAPILQWAADRTE